MATPQRSGPGPDGEVLEICRDLIRIDSSNYGDGSGPGERAAAEQVASLLDDVGLDPRVLEAAPGRASVVVHVPGADPRRTDGLLVHGHLDVVPADPKQWRYDPFAAEVADGCVWGRGAVDMKDTDAMVLSVMRARLRSGRLPSRPMVLCFTADEEAGGVYGAHWLVDHHPELFAECTEGISEVGGFSVTIPERRDRDEKRAYLIQTAEKGIAWLRVRATGTAGHGSLPQSDNPVLKLSRALARVGTHEWPQVMTPTVAEMLSRLEEEFGEPLDPDDPEELQVHLGSIARMVQATTRNTANPTVLRAGVKTNVVPDEAVGEIDGRFLPGSQQEFLDTIDSLLGEDATRVASHIDVALEEPFHGRTVAAMAAALQEEDPGSVAVPYMLFGGTDAKAFSRLGITGYGFAPLRLPPELDFAAMFHGVDERVPIDGLRFGARVLDRFFDLA